GPAKQQPTSNNVLAGRLLAVAGGRQATPESLAACATAAATAGPTRGSSALGTILSTASSSAATSAMASAAASFISSVIARAPASSAPRNTPGKASTLLIWFGKSLRPVATTAAYCAATSGWTSGSGLDSANTIGSSAIVFSSISSIVAPDRPMNTSAPSIASGHPPLSPALLGDHASSCCTGVSPSRPPWMLPRESSTVMSPAPADSRIFAQATPAAPAPEITTRCLPRSRPSTWLAPRSAASTTIAVPCWSSCMTGQSSASISLASSSTHRGAATSSRLTAQNDGRNRTSVSTISSTSVVSSTSGIESSPPNVLNSTALPSITGSDALAPMSPRPSTAVPSLTTTTRRCAHVYRAANWAS